MKNGKRKFAIAFFFLTLLGVVLTGVWILQQEPDPPDLKAVAQPLTATKELSSINQIFYTTTDMRWINDEEVVFLEKQPTVPYFLYRQKVLPTGHAGECTLIPNATIPADASIPQPPLNSRNGLVWILENSQSPNAIQIFKAAHPNKKFIPTRQVGVTAINGSKSDSSTVQIGDLEQIIQVDNLLCAVESRGEEEIRVKLITADHYTQKVNYPSSSFPMDLMGKSAKKRLIFGYTYGGTILNSSLEAGIASLNFPNFQCLEFDLEHPESKPKSYSIRLPESTEEGATILSPVGGRFLFILQLNKTSLLDRVIHKFYPPYKIRNHYQTVWMACKLDGSEMRTVYKMKPNEEPQACLWTPDGKHISFIQDGKLYLVEVK